MANRVAAYQSAFDRSCFRRLAAFPIEIVKKQIRFERRAYAYRALRAGASEYAARYLGVSRAHLYSMAARFEYELEQLRSHAGINGSANRQYFSPIERYLEQKSDIIEIVHKMRVNDVVTPEKFRAPPP